MLNRNTGVSAYQQVDLETAVQTADPHRLILMLFDGALMAIAQAEVAIEQRNIPQRAAAINKAIAIVIEGLKAALDPEAGGELADRLAALYDYIAERLTHANALNNAAPLKEAANLLRTIRDAWAEMPEEARKKTYATS
ncbi:flagellar export chaperone FliS [Hydrogenophilus thiooxidans]|uniref:flagellar export chaperone FliS n=1 Tax=Hydrogenophilus thiooxidans TaxID=2820326 RepID=UPI001C2165CD|nr:flagellar export chaperone FliS [Hydrogenophilus thiooxidans]